MSEHTSLYRFFDKDGALLYIGITKTRVTRFDQHAASKPWWPEVCGATVEHFRTREQALDAERDAIKAEHPRYNVVHNDGNGTAVRVPPEVPPGARKWHFHPRRYREKRSDYLWLTYELSCEPCVDDVWNACGDDQVDYWIDYLLNRDRRNGRKIDYDAVPISWFVVGLNIFEAAPFQRTHHLDEDFLTHFSWPTDEDRTMGLDWFSLPVRHDRFPAFDAALGWSPSPLQRHFSLADLCASRRMQIRGYAKAPTIGTWGRSA